MAPVSPQRFQMERIPVTETLIMCKYFIREVCIEIARIHFYCWTKCEEPVWLKSGGNFIYSHTYEGMTGFDWMNGHLLITTVYVFLQTRRSLRMVDGRLQHLSLQLKFFGSSHVRFCFLMYRRNKICALCI